jgi:hypothetical protein
LPLKRYAPSLVFCSNLRFGLASEASGQRRAAGALYEAFAPAEARRILHRLEFHEARPILSRTLSVVNIHLMRAPAVSRCCCQAVISRAS